MRNGSRMIILLLVFQHILIVYSCFPMGGSAPSKSFNDVPDNTKSETAKSIDEIFLGLRTYGNIPGEDPVDDEETWLCPPEEKPTNDPNSTPAPAQANAPTLNTSITKNKNGEIADELAPARAKPPQESKNKKVGAVVVAHVESPQILSSLR